MEETNKKILVDVLVNTQDATKKAVELKKAIADLKSEQEKLDVETQEGAEQFLAIENAIKAYSKEAKANEKIIQDEVTQQLQASGAIKQLQAEYRTLSETYNSLSEAERNSSVGDGLAAQMEALQKQIKPTKEEVATLSDELGRMTSIDYSNVADVKEFETAITRAAQLRETIADLRAENKLLDRSTIEGAEAYEINNAAIRANTRELNSQVKIAENSITGNKKKEGSLQALKAELSNLTNEYNNLSRSERENVDIGHALAQQINLTKDEIKSAEEGLQDYSRNVGNYENDILSAIGVQGEFIKSLISTSSTSEASSEALQGASNKASDYAKSLLKIATSPVVLTLAGLVAIVLLLTKAFNRSEDSAASLNRVIGKLSGLFNALLDILAPVAEILVDGLVYGFEAVSSAVEYLLKGLASLLDFFGMETASKWISDTVDNVKEVNKASAELVYMRAKLLKQTRSLKEANADLAIEEAKINQLMQKQGITVVEKIKLTKELGKIQAERARNELDIAQQAYDIAVREVAINGASTDALNAKADAVERLRAAQLGIIQANNDQENSLRDLNNEARDIAIENALSSIDNRTAKNTEMYRQQMLAVKNNSSEVIRLENDIYLAKDKSEREKLKLSRSYNKITQAEYLASLEALYIARTSFDADQARKSVEAVRASNVTINSLLKDSTEYQAKAITEVYSDAIESLNNIEAPQISAAVGTEEYSKAWDEYENLIVNNAAIAVELEAERDRKIADMRKQFAKDMLSLEENSISENYETILAAAQAETSTRVSAQIAMNNELIEARRKAGKEVFTLELENRQLLAEADLAALNTVLLNQNLTDKQAYEAKRAYLEKQRELYKDNAEKQAEIGADLVDLEKSYMAQRLDNLGEWKESIGELAGGFNDLLSSISDSSTQKAEEEANERKRILDDQLASGLISQEEHDAEVLKADEKLKAEQAKAERKKAIMERGLKVFDIITNTAIGISKAVASSPMTFGLPWSAFVGANGAIQLASVLAAPLPKAARGAVIGGSPHSLGGTTIEAERGEVIINKRSSQAFMPLLSAINEIGGGVPFVDGSVSDGGFTGRYVADKANKAITAEDLAEAVSKVNVSVAVEDIRKGDSKYTDVIDRASF